MELRGNRNLINCEALGKTKLFLLPSSALWPPGREPLRLQSKPRAGRGVLGPAEQGWGSPGTLLCCCVPCCPSLGALNPEHPVCAGHPWGTAGNPSWKLELGGSVSLHPAPCSHSKLSPDPKTLVFCLIWVWTAKASPKGWIFGLPNNKWHFWGIR